MSALSYGSLPLMRIEDSEVFKITLLHTNDVHSHIEPFPIDGSRNQGLGGAARRAALIEQVRKQEERVLLVDAGDIFQGTPYFNFFGGELEFKLMTEMGYDAATVGNHDFDAGVEGLHKQLPHANFPLVSSNYDFTDTVLKSKIEDYVIVDRDPIRVGIFGLGIELAGLVPQNLYGNTQYRDPIVEANRVSKVLKKEKCDLVICLSHLGYRYREHKVSDQILANKTENIDIIIGGHTHTFMDRPEMRNNRKGEPVLINQVGWAGIILGRLDIFLEKNKKRKCITCDNMWIN